MKQEISPKTVAIVIGAIAVVVLGIGYEFLFAHSQPIRIVPKPGYARMMHPRGPDNPRLPLPGR
jgi:hypothetical protein